MFNTIKDVSDWRDDKERIALIEITKKGELRITKRTSQTKRALLSPHRQEMFEKLLHSVIARIAHEEQCHE